MIRITGLKKKSVTGPKPGSKRRILESPIWTVVALTLISTSLSSGEGLGTSFNLSTSGGPYFVHTIAFISSILSNIKLVLAQFNDGARKEQAQLRIEVMG